MFSKLVKYHRKIKKNIKTNVEKVKCQKVEIHTVERIKGPKGDKKSKMDKRSKTFKLTYLEIL